MVIVTTAANSVYAFDADTYTKLWRTNLGPYDASDENGPLRRIGAACDFMSPVHVYRGAHGTLRQGQVGGQLYSGDYGMGITSTPVADRVSGRLYISYRVAGPQQRIRALDLGSGATLADGPLIEPGFDTQAHRNRAGLALANGFVYVAFASHCEDVAAHYVFHGFLFAVDAMTLGVAGVFNDTPGAVGGGIWQAGMAPAVDANGDIFVVTGNGDFSPDGSKLSDSVVRLHPTIAASSDGKPSRVTLTAADSFTPYRQAWMSDLDLDLGSSGVLLVPGSGAAIAGGKQGVLYVLDRQHLGGFDTVHAWSESQSIAARSGTTTQFPEDYTADHVVQKIPAGTNEALPAPVAGGAISAVVRSGEQEDVVGVGHNGALWTTWESNEGAWITPAQLTGPDMTPPGANVALAAQGTNQEDAAFVGSDGALWVSAEVNGGAWAPSLPVTPRNLAPPGAGVALVQRNSAQNDAFVVGNDGALYTAFEGQNNPWALPIRLTVTNIAKPGSHVTAIARNAAQEDVFFVGVGGAVETIAELNNGPWGAPIAISPPGFVSADAQISAVVRNTAQEDIFIVGNDGAVSTSFEATNTGGRWLGPFALTNTRFAVPGACVAGVARNATDEDVFVAGNDGGVWTVSERRDGAWQPPALVTPLKLAEPGGGLAAVMRHPSQEDVFFAGSDGGIWTTFSTDGNQYTEIPIRTGLPMSDWLPWPHIHGTPVYADFQHGSRAIYYWSEKDHLKRVPWTGAALDFEHRTLASGIDGRLVVAPADAQGWGMPGGQLAMTIDPTQADSGVLFASIPLDPDSVYKRGELRAFDPLTMHELWNDAADGTWMSSTFLSPVVADGQVFMPTISGELRAYGP